MGRLEGRKVLFLVENGYEDLECWYPKIRIEEEGGTTVVASNDVGTYESKHGYPIKATKKASEVQTENYDALVIPGGTSAPDRLRTYPDVLELVRQINDQEKIIAFICHGGCVPISAGIVSGKKITGYKAIKDDIKNAGGTYLDQSVVTDKNLISSRHPGDLPDFCKTLIDKVS